MSYRFILSQILYTKSEGALATSHYFKSLVIGIMTIGLVMLSDIGVSSSAQHLEKLTGKNQNMTAQEKVTIALNNMSAGNESSGGAAPGYVHVRSSREVNATADRVLEYFMNIQDLPRFHPEFIKNVTIIEQQGNNITFNQEASFSGNNISSINKLTKPHSSNEVIIETINGTGKGSKFSLAWQETRPGATHITLDGEFVFQSPPGRPLDDIIRNVAEKRLDEDVRHLEQLSAFTK
jgi:uncharacterized membrane protein